MVPVEKKPGYPLAVAIVPRRERAGDSALPSFPNQFPPRSSRTPQDYLSSFPTRPSVKFAPSNLMWGMIFISTL